MASANTSWGDILTSTLENRDTMTADNVINNNAFLAYLNKAGKVRKIDGGNSILQPLTYLENPTAGWYSGYETLNITPSEPLSAAQFDWKQASVAVSISGLEAEVQNTGKSQFIDLLETRIDNADSTFRNMIEEGVFSDGTGSGGKQIGGLQLLIADSPSTGSPGGINRATYSFWRNYANIYGTATSTSNIKTRMNTAWVNLVLGAEQPDAIFTDNNYWSIYHDSLTDIQRITDIGEKGMTGFQTLAYKGKPVVLAGGLGGSCPTNRMYFVNFKYLFLKVHKDRYFKPLGGKREAINQDAFTKLIGFAGNMTASQLRLQGVIGE